MFTKSARFYDEMYSFKDYPKEASAIHDAIESHKSSPGRDLLDVACGTGKHLREFAKWYEVWGLDLDPDLLRLAAECAPGDRLHEADMRNFDLGRQFDAVTCLFSSIGYMKSSEDLDRAIQNMARHVKPGGVLIVEPWLYPDNYMSPHLHMLTVDRDDLKITRMSSGKRIGKLSVLDFEYLVMTFDEVFRASERHEMGLFEREEYESAMARAGLSVEYDPIGPMNRGLFLGMQKC